jgi:F0F1-type ATP synthase membrane subunit b/b'
MNIIFIAIYFVLFVLISIFAFYLYRKEQGIRARELEVFQNAQAIINKSNYKAQKLIETATSKAREILDKTKIFKTNIETYANDAVYQSVEKYVDELEKVSDDVVKSYEEMFDGLKNKYVEDEKVAITRIETQAMKQIEDFGKQVTTQNEQYAQTLEKLAEQEKLAVLQIETKASQSVDEFHSAIDQKTAGYQKLLEEIIDNEKQTIEQIDAVSKKQVDDLNNAIVQKVVDYQNYLQKFLEDEKGAVSKIEQTAIQGIADMNQKVTETTMHLQQSLEAQVVEEFKKAQAEIQQYREAERKKIEEAVGKAVNKMASEILGKTLRQEDHEKLLVEALESAKSQGLFNI